MAALTTVRAGNWSNSTVGVTPWTALTGTGTGGVPGAGDTVTMSNDVTVDVDTSVGTSPNTGGAAAITVDTNGVTLTVGTGVTFEVQGPIALNGSGYSIANPVRLHLNAGAILSIKPSSGQQYTITGTQNWWIDAAGSSGSHCTIKTDLGSGGLASYMVEANFRSVGPGVCTYTDWLDFGDTSNWGVINHIGDVGVADISITNNTFTRCNYNLSHHSDTGGDATNYTMSDCTFSSSPLKTITTPDCVYFIGGTAASTGTRTITENAFDGTVEASHMARTTYQYNLFGGGFYPGGDLDSWTLFDSNVLIHDATTGQIILKSSISNSYDVVTDTGDFHSFGIKSDLSTFACTGFIREGAGNEYGGAIFTGTPSGTMTITLKNNLLLPNGNGGTSGALLVDLSNAANTRITSEHNTFNGYNGQDAMVFSGEAASTAGIGTVISLRANLCWATPNDGSNVTNHVGQDASSVPNTNVVTSPGIGYNGFWNPSSGTCDISGTPTSTPGITGYKINNGSIDLSHDVSDDPEFVDSTRNYKAWGVHKGLTTPSYADVTSYLANPANGPLSTLIPDLMNWVRAGFAPTNTAFQAVSYPGDTSPTDANGNAWPGGSPGLGAMGVASVAATTGSIAVTLGPDTMVGSAEAGSSGSAAITLGSDAFVGSGSFSTSAEAILTLGSDTFVGFSVPFAIYVSPTQATSISWPVP